MGVALHRSSQLHDLFIQAQIEVARQVAKERNLDTEEPIPTLEFVHNVVTRWQSDRAMIKRALLLRRPINYFFHTIEEKWNIAGAKAKDRPPVLDCRLSAQDWEIIKTFDLILEPFEVVTKQLQGNGQPNKRSTTGAFHEYLPCFELLLDHLEEAVQGRVLKENAEGEMEIINIFTDVGVETRRLIKVFIKLAWQRLDKYYHLMTPTAYVAAVVFHPCKKWRLVEQMWNGLPTRRSVEWTEDYQSRIRALWTAKYKDNPTRFNQPRVNPAAHQSYIQRRLNRKIGPYRSTITQTPATVLDEYERYIVEEPIDSAQFETDPISWWKLNESRFPALSVMAVNFLSILSSSSESERTFSSAGIQSSYIRSRLSRSTISQQQCLRSWGKEGIYEPRVQLDQAEDDFTEHAMDIS